MARSTQGFGAGFASGYGLVQDQAENERKARNDKRQMDYYDERNKIAKDSETNRGLESGRRLGIDETNAATAAARVENEGLNLNNQGTKLSNDAPPPRTTLIKVLKTERTRLTVLKLI